MKNYVEKKLLSRIAISFTDNDTLIFETKSPLSDLKEAIPLVAFSPETKIIQSKRSYLAGFLLCIEVVAIIGLFVAAFRYPDIFSYINLPKLFVFIGTIAIASVFYYISAERNRRKMFFYAIDIKPLFAMSVNNNKAEQSKWASEFDAAVRNARVNSNKDNYVKIQKAIDSIQSQNLINREFADELYCRLDQLMKGSGLTS